MNQRKQRQLSYLLRRIKNSSADESLITKAKSLFEEIKQSLSGSMLKRALTILGIGLAGSSAAQTSFLAPTTNPFGIDSTYQFSSPTLADLDGDGDLDLLKGGYYGVFAYQENIGTASAPNFDADQSIPFGLTTPPSTYVSMPEFVDLDGDGDFDVVAGVQYGNVLFYENTGTSTAPAFASPVVNPFGIIPSYYWAAPTFVDIDDDGDMDMYVGEYYGTFQYFENTGSATAPAFAAPTSVALTITSYLTKLGFADFDYDGDYDVFAIEAYGNMAYFENTGTASLAAWGTKQTNPFSFTADFRIYIGTPAVIDLDDDGDMDIMTGAYYGVNIYYENNDPSASIIENNIETTVYPNPVTNQFTIAVENDFPKEVMLFDNLGKQVLTWNTKQGNYDISGLPSGVYTLKMVFSDGISIQNIIKE
ncbi:MAG: hypothetical protein ACI8Q1_000642 [Parvicella sp.]|jgi:hypothetical protein